MMGPQGGYQEGESGPWEVWFPEVGLYCYKLSS